MRNFDEKYLAYKAIKHRNEVVFAERSSKVANAFFLRNRNTILFSTRPSDITAIQHHFVRLYGFARSTARMLAYQWMEATYYLECVADKQYLVADMCRKETGLLASRFDSVF